MSFFFRGWVGGEEQDPCHGSGSVLAPGIFGHVALHNFQLWKMRTKYLLQGTDRRVKANIHDNNKTTHHLRTTCHVLGSVLSPFPTLSHGDVQQHIKARVMMPIFLMERERLSNLPQVIQMVRPDFNPELAPKTLLPNGCAKMKPREYKGL